VFDRELNTTCPTCNRPVKGRMYEDNGRALLRKECPEHGEMIDMLSSRADLFRDRLSLLDHVAPNVCSMQKCRNGIFNCKDHISRISPLAFIEITTHCNMNCPVCYADAATKGKDMPYEDICRIIDTIAEQDTNTHVILIGGEPTIHKDFFRILEKLSQKGLMKRTFIATNGITLADKAFSKKVHDAGIKKFYLGFDGTDREACKKIRGSYIAHDSVRKALENIRENGKAWIIISVTAVKDVNVDDIPATIDFAMDNSDIVKRIMISPELYCGRVTEQDKLIDARITGDCIEDFLRKALDVKVAAVSISFTSAILKPLKVMGMIDPGSWVASAPSPFCGQMGMIWKKGDGEYHSVIDLLVKDADKNAYELGRKANRFADIVLEAKRSITGKTFGRAAWPVLKYLYYMPRYITLLVTYLNKKEMMKMLGTLISTGFNIKKFKKEFFGKKVELNYILCSDKYNFIWDKMPYCMTHHYRTHSSTGEVIKLPGCLVLPFREELEQE